MAKSGYASGRRASGGKLSKTARLTCLCRAASFFEKDPRYKGDDFVAPKLIPRWMRPFIGIGPIKDAYIRALYPHGIYEYLIARTKFIDSAFCGAIRGGTRQIAMLGAGLDTRAIRLAGDCPGARIYELDYPEAQEFKSRHFSARGVKQGAGVVNVAADLNTDSLVEKLSGCGFRKGEKTLVVAEGLLMYLNTAAVDRLFDEISGICGDGTEIVFDFVHSSVLRNENSRHGGKEIHKILGEEGEPWQSGMEMDGLEKFLAGHGFALLSMLDSDGLKEKYFPDGPGEKGRKIRINGVHCVVHARI